MKMRVVLPIVLALVAGAGSLVVLDQMMSRQDADIEESPTKQVVVAAVDLSNSQKIGQGMIVIEPLPLEMPTELPRAHQKFFPFLVEWHLNLMCFRQTW